MPWPVDEAKTITARWAGNLEADILKVHVNINPIAVSRSVRSEKGSLAMIGRATSLEIRQVQDHVSWWARQYFPDTAEEENVARHGSIWDVLPRESTRAVGKLDITGKAGTNLPADLVFEASTSVQYTNPKAAQIGFDGKLSLDVEALQPGSSGNLEEGISLIQKANIIDLETIVVASGGLVGGAETEQPPEHQKAVLQHIRQRPHGGAGFDYPTWLNRKYNVRAVQVLPDWIGRGSVGVAVVMKEGLFGRAPSQAELNSMADYLGRPNSKLGVRPVTAHVVMLAATIQEIPLAVRLRPDTTEGRANIAEAWTRFLATVGDEDDEENDGPIGALLEPSRISEALSAAQGEYAHDLISPSVPLRLDAKAYPKPGQITYEGDNE